MAYKLEEINRRVREEPAEFVAECDRKYFGNVRRAAETIAGNIGKSRVVLLSGPSGSGKTTTAHNIDAELERMGIKTHTISLDDYYKDVDPETSPRDEWGNYDFESPECLDIELLTKHFNMIGAKETIYVPKFIFTEQRRDPVETRPLHIGENEVAIFEGIHALNSDVCGHGEGKNATKVYISARSNIEENGVVFKGTWIRILRRAIRDRQFRGTSPAETFGMWENLRRGEKKYISPHKNSADVIFDSSLQYEVSVLKTFADGLFDGIRENVPRYNEIMKLRDALELFEPLSADYLPPTSLIREFIGGLEYNGDVNLL